MEKSIREVVKLGVTPTVIISKELQAQILYLHSRVGDLEWSGPVFFNVLEGDIEKLDDFVIKAHIMMPKDVGSPTYTEYSMGAEMFDFFDKYPIADPMINKGVKWGHMHTHHAMDTYFSGVDMSELQENAPKHNYYVSIIVNHKGIYTAMVAIIGTVEQNVKYKGTKGEIVTSPAKNKEILMVAEFKIVLEADEYLSEGISVLIENAMKARQQKALIVNRSIPQTGRTGYRKVEVAKPEVNMIDEEEVEVDEQGYQTIIEFLPKLLLTHPYTKETLEEVLEAKDAQFTYYAQQKEFAEKVASRIEMYYSKYYTPAPGGPDNVYSFILDCAIVLDSYSEEFGIADVLAKELDKLFDNE